MRRIIAAAVAFILLAFAAVPAYAAPLDEIQSITIDAQTTADGVVTLRYEIAWKVLDSTSEGPLSWVQIGVPNDAYEITDFGGDAVSAQPYNLNGESKVRLDLAQEFEAGQTANFHFTIRQYNLLRRAANEVRCDFVPGWFDDIAVKQMTVRWQPGNVTRANRTLDGVYTWSGSLAAGEHFQTVTTYYSVNMALAAAPMPAKDDYNPSANDANYSNTYTEETSSGGLGSILSGFGALCFILPIAIVLAIFRGARGYRGGRGFGGRRGFWGGGSHGGGGCACAGCACACACAGGGRAGCARKDFTAFAHEYEDGSSGGPSADESTSSLDLPE